MTSWYSVSNAEPGITPTERSKKWGLFSSSEHSSQMALTLTLVSFKHVHCFYLMRTYVTHTLGHTFQFHSCVSRARTLHASALSPLVFSYGVCQLATMGFLMKGSARNVCTYFNVKWYFKCFIYWTADLKSSKLWSSQLWTQFKHLRIEAWKSQYMTFFNVQWHLFL